MTKITHKITQGMYILTANGGGCVVDAVMYAGRSNDQPVIAVSVAKQNHSHKLLSEQDKFGLSILGENANPALIQAFGFKSARDTDKFAGINAEIVAEVPVIKDSIGYMVLEKIDSIENDTHTIFIGRVLESEVLEDSAPMTYFFYQDNKDNFAVEIDATKTEEKDDLEKVETEQGKTAWVCTACGYVYYGDEVPDDFICPLCGLGKSFFKKKA